MVSTKALPAAARRRLLLAVAGFGLLCGCNAPPDDSPEEEVRQRLVGTWLREYEEDGTRVRRVLVLERDGTFRESAAIVQPDRPTTRVSHSGDWLFDGTNFKRRYLVMDGKPTAAPTMPFVPLELRFESRNDFTGIDNVRRRKVRYHRVADDTVA